MLKTAWRGDEFKQISMLDNEGFRRLTGVKRSTFKKMIEILIEVEVKKKARGGKPNKQYMEDRLLMTLEYLREYRTYFQFAQGYGISESACYHPNYGLKSTEKAEKIG